MKPEDFITPLVLNYVESIYFTSSLTVSFKAYLNVTNPFTPAIFKLSRLCN
jgi:hypothetical protein